MVITGANSAACCLSRGNVDNDPDGIVNIVDLTTLIAYAFDGLPQPYCFVEADFNGDGTVNIVDITNLINYLYSGGAPPAPCP